MYNGAIPDRDYHSETRMILHTFYRALLASVIGVCFAAVQALAQVEVSKKQVAVVRHRGKNRQGTYVVLDRGSNRGFVIGAEVCFYTAESQKTGCGMIERSSPRAAGVRLSRDGNGQVVVSQYAWIPAWGEFPGPPKARDIEDYYKEAVEQLVDQQQATVTPAEPPLLSRRLSVSYSPAWILPVTAHTVTFAASARASGVGSVWAQGEPQSRSLVGFTLALKIPRPGRWDDEVSFGYNFLAASPVKKDFDLTDSTQTVTSQLTAHFYRFRWQRGFTVLHTEKSDYLAGAGVDLYAVSHRFRAEHSSEGTLAQGSVLNFLLSAPLSAWGEWQWGGWVCSAGVDVTVPLYMFGRTISGEVAYSEDTIAAKDLGTLVEVMDVKKNVGLSLHVGLGSKF